MFAVYVQRTVEVHLATDTAIAPSVDASLSELLATRDADDGVEVVARVPLLGDASDDVGAKGRNVEGRDDDWQALVGDATAVESARRAVAEPLRVLKTEAAASAATDATTAPEFYRRRSLVRGVGDAGRRKTHGGNTGGGPFGAAAEVFAIYFVCVPRLLRSRDDDVMATTLLRALGLLYHLLESKLVPGEVEWRGLLLAAGQLRFLAVSAATRAFARRVASAPGAGTG